MMTANRNRAIALVLLCFAVACAPPATTTRAPGGLAGAPAARLAVEQFLGAVRAQDIQAMTAVWGTSRGPARETMEPDQLERRAIILQCYLAHDQFRIVTEAAGEAGRRVFRVELTRGNATRQPAFYTIPGPNQRWYVENVELAAVRDFCGDPGPG